jgi:hypothetical protein
MEREPATAIDDATGAAAAGLQRREMRWCRPAFSVVARHAFCFGYVAVRAGPVLYSDTKRACVVRRCVGITSGQVNPSVTHGRRHGRQLLVEDWTGQPACGLFLCLHCIVSAAGERDPLQLVVPFGECK